MKGVVMISPCCNKEVLMASKKYCIYCILPKRTAVSYRGYARNGRKNKNAKKNNDYYRRMWDLHPVKQCEECGLYLREYSASYISHIIPKGANTFLRNEPENHNILCFKCHNQWEFGNRGSMNIYPKNMEIIQRLTLKYYTNEAR